MKRTYIITALLAILCTLTSQSQTSWVTLPTNNNIQEALDFDVEVTENGGIYAAYVKYNSATTSYEFYIDRFTSSWSNIYMTSLTDVAGLEKMISTTHVGDTAYILVANDQSNDAFKLWKASAANVSLVGTYSNFLDESEDFMIQGGFTDTQLYVAGVDPSGSPTGKKMNFPSNNWGPMANFGVSGTHVTMHNTQDSIYFGFTQVVGPNEEIFVYAIQKLNPPITSSDLLFSQSLRYTHPVTSNVDIVQSVGSFYFLDRQQLTILANDAGTHVLIPVSTSGYGTGTFTAVGVADETDVDNHLDGGFILTRNSANNDAIEVFSKTAAAADLSILGPSVNTTNSSSLLRIAGLNANRHKLVGYQDDNQLPAAIEFKVNNEAPTILQNLAKTSLCGSNTSSLFNGLKVQDFDRDTVAITVTNSSNTALIDPNNIIINRSYSNLVTNFEVLAVHDASSISVPTNVTLTFSITDGLATTVFQKTFTVAPLATITQILNTDFCSNDVEVDLNDYVDIKGGAFVDDLSLTPIPSSFTPANTYSTAGTYVVRYTVSTGCYAPLNMNFSIFDAPSVTITNIIDVANCNDSTGSVTASITPGTSLVTNFQWNTGDTANLVLTALPAGTYSIEVRDENNCLAKEEAIVNLQNVVVNRTIDSVTCFGGNDGQIAITSVTGMSNITNYFWSNGQGGPTATTLTAGAYTVQITDDNNCIANRTFHVGQRAPLTLTKTKLSPDCGQTNGGIDLTISGGLPGYNFMWNNAAVTEDLTNIGYGMYDVTITDAAGCSLKDFTWVSEIGAPSISGIITKESCNASDGAIDITATAGNVPGPFNYTWSNTATTEDVDNITAGEYSVVVEDSAGCHGVAYFNVSIQPPLKNEICIISVDTLTTSNLVIWERTETTGIDYYNIYRETNVANQFIWIDSVEADDLSVFNDVVASPKVASWRYKLSAVNECGVEGPLSAPHKTIHLRFGGVGTNIDLSWNSYEGTYYDSCVISRKVGTAQWEEIATVPYGVRSFTDNPPSTTDLDYQINFELLNPCSATGRAEDFHYCRSNRSRGIFNPGSGAGYSNNSIEELVNEAVRLSYYPNPFQHEFTVSMEANMKQSYEIYNSVGMKVSEGTLLTGENKINLMSVEKGIYFLVLTENRDLVLRLVKQ